MKMKHTILLVVVGFVLLAGTGVGIVIAIPPAPDMAVFYGNVSVNGTLAPNETVVSVKVDELEELTNRTKAGKYCIKVTVSEAKHGDPVTLKIYNAVIYSTTLNKNYKVPYYDINLSLEDYLVDEPAQPDALPEATPESDILVDWTSQPGYDSTGIKCYELLKKHQNEETFSTVNKTTKTTYLDTLTTPGEYCYRLVTYDFVGNSKNSTQDVCTTFVSNKTFTLNGFVKYENGTGVSNANVTLEKYFNPVNSTTTTENGYYELAASWKRYNLTAAKGDVLVWGWEGKGGAKYISFLNSSAVVNLDANKTVNLTLVVKGDLDGDCAVGIADVRVVARMLVGSVSEDLKADFNGNGCVDLGDAAKLLGFVKGGVSKL